MAYYSALSSFKPGRVVFECQALVCIDHVAACKAHLGLPWKQPRMACITASKTSGTFSICPDMHAAEDRVTAGVKVKGVVLGMLCRVQIDCMTDCGRC